MCGLGFVGTIYRFSFFWFVYELGFSWVGFSVLQGFVKGMYFVVFMLSKAVFCLDFQSLNMCRKSM